MQTEVFVCLYEQSIKTISYTVRDNPGEGVCGKSEELLEQSGWKWKETKSGKKDGKTCVRWT